MPEDDVTTPIKALVMVAYCHAGTMSNDSMQDLVDFVIEVLEGYETTEIQMATLEILPLDSDEGVVYHVEDKDDLDDGEDVDDLREVHTHGSTPR